jgi:3-hydroxybutyryl-CoA dehydratase
MMAADFLYKGFEDITLGEKFVSRGRTITEADIVNWCALTGDWHVLHSDAHFAARSRFGQRIAPGLLVYAIGAGLGVPPDSQAIIANYGVDRLRFTAPALIGDTIHLEAEVRSKAVKREGREGLVTMSWEVRNQNDSAVLVSELKILLAWRGRRPGVNNGD